VDTFWAMLQDETQDRTELAVLQMTHVIRTLFKQAIEANDAMADQGFVCLRELRRACVQEEEPGPYNELMRGLRDEWAGGARHAFWARLDRDDDLRRGLICADETDESSVSAADAMAFVQGGPPQPAEPAPAATPAADDEYGDLE